MVETKDKVTEQTTNISEQNVEEKEYCLLPLRDIVIFPSMIIPIFIGRGKSIATVEEAMKRGKQIVLVAQKDALVNNPKREDLFDVGVKANIVQMLRLQDNTVKLLVEATSKVKITNLDIAKPYWATTIDYIPEDLNFEGNTHIETLTKCVRNSFSRYITFNKDIIIENVSGIETIESPILLLDTIIMSMNVKVEKKQEILEASNITEKLEKLYAIIETELDFMKMDRRIRSRVKQSIDKNQREFYLSEQMKAIQKELGDDGEDYDDLEKKIDKVGLSKEAYLKAKSEIKKLKNMSPQSPEYSILRNYLELLLSLPWNKKSELDKSISEAEKILDEEHYALEKVKERILEFLAVQKRVGCSKGTILCFMGPPGVGKTSLGRAIAKATGRVFEKLSLGGVHDEAEIRGHRRTYIGAQCGKILSIMKKAGVNNPLIMLDEIDKMGNDYRGDPASAMLEVLDPEQNVAFNDHYLDLDYDLSNVMFIATANSYNIPRPLLDRMEVIELSGYTEDEKIEIAKRHIIPKTLVKNGLDKSEISISDGAIRDIVRYYTRESGVRGLERQIDKMMRKSLRKIGERVECDDCLFELKEETQKPQKDKIIKITSDNITEFLGVKRFDFGKSEEKDSIGTVTGLAWTEVGGELLQIESAVMAGKGLAVFTGKLGDVMKESIETAKSFVRSHSAQFGINSKIWDKIDIHIHVPEGATPKDGPSAGIAMMTSIVSTLTEIPVRKDVAMTGEITLRGRVLPIGGLKEKLLAALRGGIKTVAIPFENVKDLEEIPQVVKDGLKIIPVKTADEVLKIALSKPLQPIKEVGDFFENLLKTPSKPQGEIVQ
ncbi:MAG: endopeptidase La [Alphaproteobacteria bacterium]|nr:endopeptidase La [Alphaproteobacteria bacterium]